MGTILMRKYFMPIRSLMVFALVGEISCWFKFILALEEDNGWDVSVFSVFKEPGWDVNDGSIDGLLK